MSEEKANVFGGLTHHLGWRRIGRIRLRSLRGGEIQVTSHLRDQLSQVEIAVDEGRLDQGIFVDDQLVGSTGFYCADLESAPSRTVVPSSHLPELRAHRGGRWAVKTGTLIDHRLAATESEGLWRRLIRHVGPVACATYAARYDLEGYLSVVPLRGLPGYRPSLDAQSYVQQVQAGSIDEPWLGAHLKFGAHVVAVADTKESPVALICWTMA